MFEDSPIALWEEDFSAVKQRLDALRNEGVTNFEEYLSAHPELVTECEALIKVLDVNKATMALYGAGRKEEILKGLAKALEGEPTESFRDELVSIAAGETSFTWEGLNKTLDDRLINVNLNWSAAPEYKESLSRVIVSMIDITKRKHAEETLRLSEERYRSLFENMLEGFAYCRMIFEEDQPRDFIYLDVNSAFEQATGLKNVVGRKVTEVIPGIRETNPELFEIYGRVASGGKPERFETFVKPLGIWLSVSVYCPASGHFVAVFDNITERKKAEEKVKSQLQFLVALRETDQVIASTYGLSMSLETLLTHAVAQLKADAADVLLFKPAMRALEYVAGRGFRNSAVRKASLRLGEGYAGRATIERKSIRIADLRQQNTNDRAGEGFEAEGFVGYHAVPLVSKGKVVGVLEVFQRTPIRRDVEWTNRLDILAGQAAIALENGLLFENLERSNFELSMAYDATIAGWSHALDLRDKETEGHTERVTEATLKLAGRFHLTDERLMHIRRGALLHDIGKMGVPDGILLKPDKLSEEEWKIMRQHPQFAYDMLAPIHYLKAAMDIPYCHHEKWDGTGYPRGLQGEQIPLEARIFAIVDVWDALTSDRPYRKAWTHEKALEYIKAQAGKHFDPEVVRIFLESGLASKSKYAT